MTLRLALVSLALVALGPLATRFGLVRFPIGMALVAVGSLGGAAAVGLSSLALVRGGAAGAVWALLAGGAALAAPLSQVLSGGMPPPIHDITTDTMDPPLFDALVPLRGSGVSPAAYDGQEAADQQRRAYPDVEPILLALQPDQALARAESVARALGWTVVSTAPGEGRLEATDTTFWFRFTDDIVVRVRPDAGGSRVDVRSKSRVGRGDLGKNAGRIRAFAARLRTSEE